MVAHQPNPNNRNPDDISPVMYDQGWRAKTTETADPPQRHYTWQAPGRRSPRGYTIPLDADEDPSRNPRKAEYSDEEMGVFHELAKSERGARGVIAALRTAQQEKAQKDARKTEATPEELEAQHTAAIEGWAEEDDDTALTNLLDDPAWAWKRPREL